ncbi:MAG: hypothetical protein ABIH78_01160, partial [Candidatus Peregrinibacteria bacterium]
HQYSRTRLLLHDFGKAFMNVDKVIVPNIYRVRDTDEDIKKVSTDDLVREINLNSYSLKTSTGHKASNGHGFEKTADYIKKHHANFDIIVTMGAGDISDIYKLF